MGLVKITVLLRFTLAACNLQKKRGKASVQCAGIIHQMPSIDPFFRPPA